MILSMTGFASQALDLPSGRLSIEIRAVNHRYLDIQIHIPPMLRPLERTIHEIIKNKILRGRVECTINLSAGNANTLLLQVNYPLLAKLMKLSAEVQQYTAVKGRMHLSELLQWPGVLVSEETAGQDLQGAILSAIPRIIDDFIESRKREGAKLAAFVQLRLQQITHCLDTITPYLAEEMAHFQDKLRQRFIRALPTLNEERLYQEIGLFAQKSDIAEEISRVGAHVEEIERILKGTSPSVGKRLDFLMQELNREANTIGSKSISIKISQAAVELKVLIEQMREQVQNIE